MNYFTYYMLFVCFALNILSCSTKMNNGSFLYFAYGSNMLKKRIHINNPSAVFVDIGKLNDHRLDFIKYSKRWGGASATIVPTANSHVWGTIWEIDNEHLASLDEQEGVGANVYFAKEVEIISLDPEPKVRKCRVYQQTINPPSRLNGEEIPEDRLPSKTYLDVIISGAIESKLPQQYIEFLKNIKHNGQLAEPKLLSELSKQ